MQCVCRVLSVFWDLVPTQTSGLFLHHLVANLAADAGAPAVRAAVLRGLAFVLDNHLTHPLLQGLLVQLRPLIHDKSERVRVAMCDLLLKVPPPPPSCRPPPFPARAAPRDCGGGGGGRRR